MTTTTRVAALAAAGAIATMLAAQGTSTARSIDNVPTAYVAAVQAAPLICAAEQITAEFIAAQLDKESGFNAQATGPLGQRGPAQLLPEQIHTYLRDNDGDGSASPTDIADSVHALVRLDCSIIEHLGAAGKATDQETIAAAYKAGIAGTEWPAAREYARSVLAAM